jgi:hypothetical protein
MSRIKILLLILIAAALSIVFIQNRELIVLKLLCADSSKTCLYQTPPLPLAIWIAIATLTGAIANLLVQSLNRYGYIDSERKKPILENDLYTNSPTGLNNNVRPSKYPEVDSLRKSFSEQIPETKSYEVKQEPQNVQRSGSTYSYKYRESSDRPKNSTEPEVDSNTNDEDWI